MYLFMLLNFFLQEVHVSGIFLLSIEVETIFFYQADIKNCQNLEEASNVLSLYLHNNLIIF